jgi:transposase
LRELSLAEQRYQAVLAVIGDGLTVSQAAEKTGVARQTLHRRLARYESEGLDGFCGSVASAGGLSASDAGAVQAAVVELRRSRP